MKKSWLTKKVDEEESLLMTKVDWRRKLMDEESQLTKKADYGHRIMDEWMDNASC